MKLKSIEEFLKEKYSSLDEMAKPRKLVIKQTRDLEYIINLHLIKVLAFEDEINLNKHLSDIDDWLQKIQSYKVKETKKNLSKDVYYNILFNEPITNSNNVSYITNTIKRRLKEYHNLNRTKLSDKDILLELEKIHQLLAELLSNDTLNDFKVDVWDKI